jgi:phosphatidylcholine synthase
MAWSVHLFTTSGVVAGMLALQAVFNRHAERAIWFLLLTQLIDGIDGPMARHVDVKATVPKIDGYVLDLVIDYVTCVVVPAAFMHQFGLLPSGLSLPLVGAVVFFSAIWFSRTDMMTEEDHWFNGFPAVWNMVAPTMYLMQSRMWINAAVTAMLCALMLTDVKFPHSVRSPQMRIPTLTMTVLWMGAIGFGTLRLPDVSMAAKVLLGLSMAYFVGLSAWRTTIGEPRRTRADTREPIISGKA